MIEIVLALGVPVFFLGFIAGIYFVLGGGLYVNKHGLVDIRWPRRRL